MKALFYFFQLLSVYPQWAIIALLMFGAYQIICLAMALRSKDVDSIRFTPWSFTLQKKKEVIVTPPSTTKNTTPPSKGQLSKGNKRGKKPPPAPT